MIPARLPFSGRSPIARTNSLKAAQRAAQSRARKSSEYLDWLRKVKHATDHGAAEHFGWPLSSVCSIRNGWMERGQVKAIGSCEGRYHRSVTIWAPTEF